MLKKGTVLGSVNTTSEKRGKLKSGMILGDVNVKTIRNEIGFDTLSSDMSSLGRTVEGIYNGWHSKDVMKNTKSKVQNMYNRLKSFQAYNTDFGDGSVDVSEQINAYKSVLDDWDKLTKSYGKFKSADEYNEAVKIYELEKMPSAEIKKQITSSKEIYETELAPLKAEYDRLNRDIRFYGRGDRSKLSTAKDYNNAKKRRDELKKQITSLQSKNDIAYTALNGRNITWSSLYENKKAEEDFEKFQAAIKNKDFEEKSQKGLSRKNPSPNLTETIEKIDGKWYTTTGKFGKKKEIKNILTFVRDNTDSVGNVKATQDFQILLKATDNEVNLYSYLLETDEKKAQRYLDLLMPTLLDRESDDLKERIDIPVLKHALSVAQGTANYLDSVGIADYSDDATMSAMQKLQSEAKGLDKYLMGAGTTIGNMLPSILLSWLTSGIASGLGASEKVISSVGRLTNAASVGISAKGSAYKQKIAEGWNPEDAQTYSTLVGISEATLESILSGIVGTTGIGPEDLLKKADMIDNALLKFSAKSGISLASEELEEITQLYLEPTFEVIIKGGDYDQPTIDELVETAIVTAISTGFFNSPTSISKAVDDYKQTQLSKAIKIKSQNKEYISLEEFSNSEAKVWKNVDYNDNDTKTALMQETHTRMVQEGLVVKVSEDTQSQVGESFPDLRSMKKKERTSILKESMEKLKTNLRQFLNGFKNQDFEFSVNGKVLEAILYNTGINEVLEKITQKKANMLFSTEEIFKNAQYLYSTTDYSGDPNVYRWNYFYTPVQIGEETVGVRIAVRDLAKQNESQIYNWGIKKDTSLDGVRDDKNRKSHGISSDVSNTKVPQKVPGVKTIISNFNQNNTQADPNGPANFMPEGENEQSGKETRLIKGLPERRHIDKDEQDFIKRICDKLGVKMKFIHITPELLAEKGYKFEDGILPDGFFDKDTDTLYIGFTVIDPVGFIFKHELTHFGEGTQQYKNFVKAVKKSKAYKKWLIKTTGLNPKENSFVVMEAAARSKYIEARKQEGDFGPAKAEAEMIADFVGDYLFNEDGTKIEGILSGLNYKDRNAVIRYILDFLSYLKKKLSGEKNLVFEISRLEDNFNRMLSEAVQTKNTPTKISGDLEFSVAGDSVIDLSNDNELSKRIGDLHGANKYKTIQNYILETLSGQKIRLSDGKNSIVDKRDALHIAHGSGIQKTAQISKIKEIIEKAQLYAEDNNVEHNKFVNFYYYATNVRYDGETFAVYLNVGEGKTDGQYHIYDITKKIRDTAHRVNDVGRPVGNALENGISNDSISDNQSTVNNKYAQESENNSKGNLEFTFARENNNSLIRKAEKMEKKGISENDIFKKYGIIRDNGGVWVNEIDDSKMKIYLDGDALIKDDPDYEEYITLNQKENWTEEEAERFSYLDDKFLIKYGYGNGALKNFVVHKDLFKKYPEIKEVKVDFKKRSNNGETGAFIPSQNKFIFYIENIIEEGTTLEETLIHEIQHFVQNIDGREKGADIEFWKTRLARGKKKPNIPQIPGFKEEYGEDADAYVAYLLTSGEIEAEESASRVKMNAKERRNQAPNYIREFAINVSEYENIELEGEYTEAIKRNDNTALRKIIDKAARKSGYTERLYHQTGADFTEFNTDNQKAGKFDWELPTGMFLKPSNDDIGLKGKKQMELYAKMQNPLNFKDRTDAQRFWRKNVPGYKEAADNVIKIDIEYSEKVNNATTAARKYLKEWKQNNPDSNSRDIYKDGEYLRLKDIEDSIADEWESKSDEASIDAKKLIDKYISKNDYDGIVVEKDQDGIDRQTKTYIVFNSNQLKDAAPITYDDNGNVISLSQRFDESKKDIRFSVPSINQNFTEAMNLLNQELQNGKISRDEFKAKVDILFKEAGEIYGTIKKGETVTGEENFDNPVPKSVDDRTKIRQYTRTILEGGQLTEEMLSVTKQMILSGELSYTPATNEKNKAAADKIIESGHAEDRWNKIVNCKEMPNAQSITLGEILLKNAVDRKDTVATAKLIAEITEVGTRLGQSVQVLSLLKRMDGIGQLYYVQKAVNTLNNDLKEKYKKNPVTIVINETLAQQLAESKTKEDFEITYAAILNDIASQVPSTFLDKFNAWRYLAMLANPITHIKNFGGNAVFLPAVKIKDIIAYSGERFIDKSKRTKSVVIKKEYKEFAKSDFSEVEDVITSGGKMNPKRSIADNKPIFKNKVLENIRNFNFDMLEKEDAIFLKGHYIRALGGYLQARELNLKTISPTVLQGAREYAILEAQKATFRDASAIANWLANGSQKSFVGNILIEGTLPFKKTSANVLKRSVEYSPIGLMTTVGKAIKDFRSGDFTVSQFVDGLASNLTGTGIFVLGMWLAASGIVSGGSDGDDEDWFDKMLGKQDYSVEIGGISYTVDWMAPSSVPFFMGVSVMESILAEDNTAVFANVLEGLGIGINPIIELSMLNGVQGALETIRYSEPKELLPNLIINSAESYVLQMLPTLGTKFANLIDPVRRSNYIDKTSPIPEFLQSVANKAAAKIPFASKLKAEYINAWGEKENKGDFVTRLFQNFISPGYLSRVDIDKMEVEIKRLAKSTTNMSVFPDTAPKYIRFKNITKHLKRDEYEVYAMAKGQMSADYIKEAIESKEYQKLNDEQKAEVVTNLYAFANAKAKAKLIYSYEEISVMNEDVTEEMYKGYSDKVKKVIAEEYFLQKFKTVSRIERNGRSVVGYYCRKAKEN